MTEQRCPCGSELPTPGPGDRCYVCLLSEPNLRDAEEEALRADNHELREKVARLEAKVNSQGEVLSYCASVPNEADRRFVQRLVAEVICARRKFPSSAYMFAALIEEVGEVGQAICEGDKEGLRDELVQVACTAMRMAVEGDPAYPVRTVCTGRKEEPR